MSDRQAANTTVTGRTQSEANATVEQSTMVSYRFGVPTEGHMGEGMGSWEAKQPRNY